MSRTAADRRRRENLVAACTEIFDPPGCVTLWRLPEAVEEAFDARWEHWLDNAGDWTGFFEKLESLSGTDLTQILRDFELVSDRDVEAFVDVLRQYVPSEKLHAAYEEFLQRIRRPEPEQDPEQLSGDDEDDDGDGD